jgi:hypothetical protein
MVILMLVGSANRLRVSFRRRRVVDSVILERRRWGVVRRVGLLVIVERNI